MELRDICKSYGENAVLENFSLNIGDGETVLISGPSGRGKTTLLRILMGLEAPEKGEVRAVPSRISAVFQEDRLPLEFSAFKCVSLVLPSSVSREDISESFKMLGLSGEENKPAKELSGGMRRRVAIMRAMLSPSEAVFLDEPFTGLDPETKRKTIDYIKKTAQGRTLVVVSHAKEDAALLNAREIEI